MCGFSEWYSAIASGLPSFRGFPGGRLTAISFGRGRWRAQIVTFYQNPVLIGGAKGGR